MKSAIREVNHTKICPEHTAKAQMINRPDGVIYRAKCVRCGGVSPEYTKEQWGKKWPKGIGTEWPKKKSPTMIFDGVDFVEDKTPKNWK